MTWFNPHDMQDRVLDRQQELIRDAAAHRLAKEARIPKPSRFHLLAARLTIVLSCLRASLSQPIRLPEQRRMTPEAR